ncbi:MAG: hypothetical protein AB1589_31995 [Cyanobacteriota bacterium]
MSEVRKCDRYYPDLRIAALKAIILIVAIANQINPAIAFIFAILKAKPSLFLLTPDFP